MKRKHISIPAMVLVLCLLVTMLAIPTYADAGTTTVSTVYKDNSANTEIYMVSATPGSNYTYYGAKNEPQGGVYFGRTVQGGTLPSGGYGAVNTNELKNASITSFYYELSGYDVDSNGKVQYPLSYWSYLYGGSPASEKPLMDGNHALLIYLNFVHEKSDCAKFTNGTYDTQLIEDFQYLNTLEFPVFMRIAGEVNVWSGVTSSNAKSLASTYISAYQHIAKLARKYAPNVALIFSPNYSSGYEVDMDVFYPGDAYVDWVGASLYYNRYSNVSSASQTEKDDAFYGVGRYGDPILNAQQIINLSHLHNKPVIFTEGGSAWTMSGKDTQSFAADRVEKAYAYLSMVYPEVKAIVYSDYKGHDGDYTIYNNSTMTAAYNKGVKSNPTLLSSLQATPSYYVKAGSVTGEWTGTVQLAAYTFANPLNQKPTATWYVDGAAKATVSDYPYSFSFNADTLGGGSHTVEVRFSNGEKKSVSFQATHTHVWNDGKLTTPMTDTQDGVVTYTCKYCSETTTTILPAGGSPFVDVQKKSQYYYDPVMWATSTTPRITAGTSAFTFEPNATCTRAQVVTFLWRAAGEPEPETTDNPFADVSSSRYYYKAVLWAVENNITLGKSATKFAPDDPCTRAQVVTFLWRAAERPEPTATETSFADVPITQYYYTPVLWAVENNITLGKSTTEFAPDDPCTRGQIVTFLYRFYN